MRITIVLPRLSPFPNGGYKVHYEYARHLAARGHEVTVVHAYTHERRPSLTVRLRGRRWKRRIAASPGPPVPWFQFGPGVRLKVISTLHPRLLPDADVTVATAWGTAERLRETPARLGGRAYLVYDYEHWMLADENTRRRIGATFRSEWHIAATSPSVLQMLAEYDVTPATYLPAGIDFATFGLDRPVAERHGRVIGFPDRHREPSKGTADAVAAVTRLRDELAEDVEVIAFGRWPSPGLPPWIRFVELPGDRRLREIYNRVGTFVLPSHFEGWGLPGVEALACGAALVTADSVGNREYARDGDTALVVPRGRPDLLAKALQQLIHDESLRRRLASAGHAFVQRYTWDRPTEALEAMLTAAAGTPPGAVRPTAFPGDA